MAADCGVFRFLRCSVNGDYICWAPAFDAFVFFFFFRWKTPFAKFLICSVFFFRRKTPFAKFLLCSVDGALAEFCADVFL